MNGLVEVDGDQNKGTDREDNGGRLSNRSEENLLMLDGHIVITRL